MNVLTSITGDTVYLNLKNDSPIRFCFFVSVSTSLQRTFLSASWSTLELSLSSMVKSIAYFFQNLYIVVTSRTTIWLIRNRHPFSHNSFNWQGSHPLVKVEEWFFNLFLFFSVSVWTFFSKDCLIDLMKFLRTFDIFDSRVHSMFFQYIYIVVTSRRTIWLTLDMHPLSYNSFKCHLDPQLLPMLLRFLLEILNPI